MERINSHGSHLLWFHADESAAVDGAAVASLLLRADALEVVVERELSARRDVAQGEQAHARVAAHRPLLRLAVGLAAVVHEPNGDAPHGMIS